MKKKPGAGQRVWIGTTVPETLGFFRKWTAALEGHGFELSFWSSPGPSLRRFGDEERCVTAAIQQSRSIAPIRDLLALAKLCGLFVRERPAIVHAHTPKAGILGMLAAMLAAVPVRMYHIHGFPFVTLAGGKRRLLQCVDRVAVKCATGVYAVGDGVRRTAEEEGIAERGEIRVLLHGSISGVDARERFNPERFPAGQRQARRTALGIETGATVVLFAGRLVKDKGVAELIGAWRRVAAAEPKAYLVVIGGYDERDDSGARFHRELSELPRCRVAGAVEDPENFYAVADMLVLPTYREGLPYALLEAAAMARPVIASRVPGCCDIVKDGETGQLVPVRDVEAIANAMKKYIADPELGRRHGRQARDLVLAEYSPQDMWVAVAREYELSLVRSGESNVV